MLARPPACRGAVQRQLTQLDSIWISDETLHYVFQRFAKSSQTGRRHGSFVPGPMESRRRLGKRRMAHLSEVDSTPTHAMGSIWEFLVGSVDRTKWKWEAPTARKSDATAAPALPAWLSEWDTSAQEANSELVLLKQATKRATCIMSIDEKILDFKTRVGNSTRDNITGILDGFSQDFKQSLMLGQVSESTLNDVLTYFSKILTPKFSGMGLLISGCLSFYQATWGGIQASKVFRPMDLDIATVNHFLSCLAKLPLTSAVWDLVHSVLDQLSASQLASQVSASELGTHISTSQTSIHWAMVRLVKAYVKSWAREERKMESYMLMIEATIISTEQTLAALHGLSTSINASSNIECYNNANESLRNARLHVDSALRALSTAENNVLAFGSNLASLSRTLRYLPRRSLEKTVLYSFISIAKNPARYSPSFTSYLLSVVTQLPQASNRLFLEACRELKPFWAYHRLGPEFNAFLGHWAKQGSLEQAPSIRESFQPSARGYTSGDLCLMLRGIDGYREECWKHTQLLFDFLMKLGNHKTALNLILKMSQLNMKLPAFIVDPLVVAMSKYDPSAAFRICKAYLRMRWDMEVLHLENQPNIIISMIHAPFVYPSEIWRVLEIPIYKDLPSRAKYAFSDETLSPSMIHLISIMAWEFSRCKRISRRQAIQQVTNCLHHLRRHRAAVPSELSRALTQAGIMRGMLEEKWISEEFVSWNLRVIQEGESTESAMTVGGVVSEWNRDIAVGQAGERRDRNPLRLGSIG